MCSPQQWLWMWRQKLLVKLVICLEVSWLHKDGLRLKKGIWALTSSGWSFRLCENKLYLREDLVVVRIRTQWSARGHVTEHGSCNEIISALVDNFHHLLLLQNWHTKKCMKRDIMAKIKIIYLMEISLQWPPKACIEMNIVEINTFLTHRWGYQFWCCFETSSVAQINCELVALGL